MYVFYIFILQIIDFSGSQINFDQFSKGFIWTDAAGQQSNYLY